MKTHPAVRFLAFSLLLLVIPAALSSPSSAQIAIGVSVRIGPPALPVYEQPICPAAGYLWTPGYWAWSDDAGYYWVPGTWVQPPTVGLLWTPGYWGWNDGVYAWNAGYWGPQIGFYGGINYGFGYGGVGFVGGEWRGGTFFYNTAVMHVNTTQITNVYVNRTVIVNNESHVAFNGGEGGVAARPTAQEEAYSREKHTPPVAAQVRQQHAASQNKALFASNNHGAPAVAATEKPGVFSGAGVVRAKSAGAPYHAPAMSPKEARASAPAARHPTPSKEAPKEAKTANRNSTSPSKGKASNSSRSETASKEKSARPNESHPAKASTPSLRASNAPREPKNPAASESRAESKSRPTPKESAPKESASEPSHSAAPKPESKPAAPKESAPKARAPKPSHSAPTPKPQKASRPPKPESEPKGH
jgi:WXXGXW repeat (2 copies)